MVEDPAAPKKNVPATGAMMVNSHHLFVSVFDMTGRRVETGVTLMKTDHTTG